jgi:hypothetical protein
LSLTVREERKLRAFKNMALRIKIGPHRHDVEGDWRKLHSEELHDFYSSPNVTRVIKSRRMRFVTPIGETKDECRNLVGKTEGKTPLGKPRREHNSKMDLQERRGLD